MRVDLRLAVSANRAVQQQYDSGHFAAKRNVGIWDGGFTSRKFRLEFWEKLFENPTDGAVQQR